MAYTYCSKCDKELDQPSPREILEQEITCSCGKVFEMSDYEKTEFLIELEERVKAIEERLA